MASRIQRNPLPWAEPSPNVNYAEKSFLLNWQHLPAHSLAYKAGANESTVCRALTGEEKDKDFSHGYDKNYNEHMFHKTSIQPLHYWTATEINEWYHMYWNAY